MNEDFGVKIHVYFAFKMFQVGFGFQITFNVKYTCTSMCQYVCCVYIYIRLGIKLTLKNYKASNLPYQEISLAYSNGTLEFETN